MRKSSSSEAVAIFATICWRGLFLNSCSQDREVDVRRLTFGVLILALSLLSVPALNAKQEPGTRSSRKGQMIAEVQSLPAQQVKFVIVDGSPLVVQAASAREIDQNTYLGLTGQPTLSSMSTYPDIVMVNTSGRTITSFILIFHSKVEGGSHYSIVKNLSIASGSAYAYAFKEWLLEDKVTVRKDDGTFKSAMRKPGPDSTKFWIPGAVSDLQVVVSRVVFEDGSQWNVPADFHW
jgi:hypothetical protein